MFTKAEISERFYLRFVLLSEVVLLLRNTCNLIVNWLNAAFWKKQTERFQNQVSTCGWKVSAIIAFKSNFFLIYFERRSKTNPVFRAGKQGSWGWNEGGLTDDGEVLGPCGPASSSFSLHLWRCSRSPLGVIQDRQGFHPVSCSEPGRHM